MKKSLFFLPFLFGVLVWGCEKTPPNSQKSVVRSQILATYGNHSISIQEFRKAIQGQSSFMQRRLQQFPQQLDFLKKLLLKKILIEEAKKTHSPTNPELQAIQDRSLVMMFIKQDLGQIKVAQLREESLKKLYEQVKSKHKNYERRIARHIYFKIPIGVTPAIEAKIKKQAEEVLEMLQKKNTIEFFSQTAKEISENPDTQKTGGLIAKTFEKRPLKEQRSLFWFKNVFALPKGGISKVLKTKRGFHIIRVDEVYPSAHKSYEELLPFLQQTLLAQAQQKRFEQKTKELQNKYKTQIFQDRLLEVEKEWLAIQQKKMKKK